MMLFLIYWHEKYRNVQQYKQEVQCNGSYNDLENSSSCMICPPGSYSPNTTFCIFCLAGTYSPSPNSTFCLEADPGFHVPTSNSSDELLCPPGTYTNISGSINCSLCPNGYTSFTNRTGCSFNINSNTCILPGQYYNGTNCTNCTETNQVTNSSLYPCQDCPPNTCSNGTNCGSCMINCSWTQFCDTTCGYGNSYSQCMNQYGTCHDQYCFTEQPPVGYCKEGTTNITTVYIDCKIILMSIFDCNNTYVEDTFVVDDGYIY